jgi:polyisoprenyl-phosphate glycosyltransferase
LQKYRDRILDRAVHMLPCLHGIIVRMKTLYFGSDLPGYPSLMVVILFLGGVQLMALGVIGEYLGRTFNEVKNRPLYFVQRYDPPASTMYDTSERSDAYSI